MKLVFLLIALLIIPIASASDLSIYENQVLVDLDKAKYNILLTFENNPEGRIEMPFFFEINNFQHKANFGGYDCNLQKEKWGGKIVCDFENTTGIQRSLVFEFESDLVPKSLESGYLFEINSKTPLNAKKMVLRVKLEEGLVLSGSSSLKPYSPESGVKGSDGRKIFVEWVKENVVKEDSINANIVFESLPTYKSVGPDLSLFYLLFGVIIVAIAVLFFYRTRVGGIETAMTILRDDERKVIGILEELGGKAKQRQIQEKGDFSKATLSRLIKNLEERGLLKTERLGRTNRIYLNKEVEKKKEEPAPIVQSQPDQSNPIS